MQQSIELLSSSDDTAHIKSLESEIQGLLRVASDEDRACFRPLFRAALLQSRSNINALNMKVRQELLYSDAVGDRSVNATRNRITKGLREAVGMIDNQVGSSTSALGALRKPAFSF